MDDNEKKTCSGETKRNYVGYEYKEIMADRQLVSLLLDGYENFGWEVNDHLPESGMGGKTGIERKVMIRLRRDRKILNKAELTRLQRNFEACVAEIQTLEQRKTSAATAYAIILGVIGTRNRQKR